MSDKNSPPPFKVGDRIQWLDGFGGGIDRVVLGTIWDEKWYVIYRCADEVMPHLAEAKRFVLKPWVPKVGDKVKASDPFSTLNTWTWTIRHIDPNDADPMVMMHSSQGYGLCRASNLKLAE